MTSQFENHDNGLRQVILENSCLINQPEGNAVPDILHAVREHLNMEVAFVSEFINGQRVFRYVDSDWTDSPVHAGFGHPLDASYCQRIVDKRLPELMQNAQKNPVAAAMNITASVPIGAYLSVPLRLADGSLYGTFCCFSRSADYTLNERDLSLMRAFAELAAKIIDRERFFNSRKNENRERIVSTLQNNALTMVYQPIFDLIERQIVGFESLVRFPDFATRTPDLWFNEAHAIGLGVELETRAIKMALEIYPKLKQNAYLTINASPEMILMGALDHLLTQEVELEHLVLEITEHAIVHKYKEISAVLAPYRKRGLQIAVDDAGAGYASFRHILNLAPDRIKLDISLTRDIDSDPARRALAVAFVHFSADTGSKLIAEGVETPAELATLQELGVTGAQGFFLGRPMSMQDVLNKPWQKMEAVSSKFIKTAPDQHS
jgi:EAL domain-containing protein (putative c-di-GMP-specific phosphodiesterase class I)